MKKFKGHKSVDQIIADCTKNGWPVNTKKYDAGSDWMKFGFVHNSKRIEVTYCDFNGHFYAHNGPVIASHDDFELDNVPWYAALLDFIYTKEKVSA